jgi:hypothetical protein
MKYAAVVSITVLILAGNLLAQGSISGTVTRSTGGLPSAAAFVFFGFLDHTDEEIRVVGADGSGYDGLNWWDDFQNYLTEAAGNPYDYYFFDMQAGEAYHLDKLIPQNSFQVEDVTTSPAAFPTAPVIGSITAASPSSVKISWSGSSGATYHVYRRLASINGSFFRRDDTAGSLSNHGVVDTSFIDISIDSIRQYEYLVIAEDAQGRFSPPSEPASAASYRCGDTDGSGRVDLSDAVFLIAFIFGEGAAPNPLVVADVDCSGLVDISDAVYLVAFIFGEGAAPCSGC